MSSQANPKVSAGARAERKAVLAYVRRSKNRADKDGSLVSASVWRYIEQWVMTRQRRYDKARGGLGKR